MGEHAKELVSISQAARLINKSVSTVRIRAANLSTPPQRLGPRRDRYFTVAQVEELKAMKGGE